MKKKTKKKRDSWSKWAKEVFNRQYGSEQRICLCPRCDMGKRYRALRARDRARRLLRGAK